MASQAKHRSLRHEFALYVEREIEAYKESVPRSVLLALGDEAVAGLAAQAQFTLTELVVWEEVDRIIASRLELPRYDLWRRRRQNRLKRMRQPETWALPPDGALASAVRAAGGGEHVLLAGVRDEGTTLFAAAHGCMVTVLTAEPELLDRMFAAADTVGVGSQLRGCVCPLGGWAPDVRLDLVVYADQAFDGLADTERIEAVRELRRATADGGVHLLYAVDQSHAAVSLDEWRSWYQGWEVTVEAAGGRPVTYRAQPMAVRARAVENQR